MDQRIGFKVLSVLKDDDKKISFEELEQLLSGLFDGACQCAKKHMVDYFSSEEPFHSYHKELHDFFQGRASGVEIALKLLSHLDVTNQVNHGVKAEKNK